MRVLDVLFDDRLGGPQRCAIQVARALQRYGVETILCLPDRGGNAVEVAKKEGVSVRRLVFARIPRPTDWRQVLRWLAHQPRDIRRFVSLYRRERPDVVRVNGGFFLAPAVAAKAMRLRLVWHLIDTIVPFPLAPVLGLFVWLLADEVMVASGAVATHYGLRRLPHQVIYGPVDLSLLGSIPPWKSLRSPDSYRVGLIGNWNPVKGLEYFVEAAARLREHLGDKLEVVFAGAKLTTQDDYRRRIETLINKLGLARAVRDHGFANDVLGVLRALDVLVLSSTSEGGPMVVLEGMAAGVPVVATAVGGVPELLLADPQRPAGILVPPRDAAALAQALLDLWRNPTKAAALAANGRALAERFSLEACAQQYLGLYSSLLQPGRRSRPA